MSIWRKGSLLVVMRSVSFLPHFCVKCGEPAATSIKRKFEYRNPAGLLLTLVCLPFGHLLLPATKSLTLRVPLCRKHVVRLRVLTVVALALILGSIPLGYVIGGNPGLATGFFGFLGGLILMITASNVIRPVKMTDSETTFTGFGEPYLRRFGGGS